MFVYVLEVSVFEKVVRCFVLAPRAMARLSPPPASTSSVGCGRAFGPRASFSHLGPRQLGAQCAEYIVASLACWDPFPVTGVLGIFGAACPSASLLHPPKRNRIS